MDDEAMEAEAKAEIERRLLAVFQERLRAHGRKLSDADALAFLRKQRKLLIVAAFSMPRPECNHPSATGRAGHCRRKCASVAAAPRCRPRQRALEPWTAPSPACRSQDVGRHHLPRVLSHLAAVAGTLASAGAPGQRAGALRIEGCAGDGRSHHGRGARLQTGRVRDRIASRAVDSEKPRRGSTSRLWYVWRGEG